MLQESRTGPTLVPIEKVAVPKNEAEDKATRRMIAQLEQTLIPRFPLEITGDAQEFQSLHFVELTQAGGEGSLRAALRTSDKQYQLQPNQNVELISGMCFFGSSGLNGFDKNGSGISLADPDDVSEAFIQQIVEIGETNLLHISEASSILRTTGAIQQLAGAQEQSGQTGKIRCSFHLPVPEYKLYMLKLIQEGKMKPELFAQLAQRIETRAAFLAQMVRKRIPDSVELTFFSPLQMLEPLFQEKGAQTTFAESLLRLQPSPMWRALLGQNPPRDSSDLPKLAYTAGYVQKATAADQNGAGCLAVEIAEEQTILRKSQEFAAQEGFKLNMAALYVMPDVVTLNGRQGKKALFKHMPTEVSELQELKLVVKNSKGNVCKNLR